MEDRMDEEAQRREEVKEKSSEEQEHDTNMNEELKALQLKKTHANEGNIFTTLTMQASHLERNPENK